MRTISPRGPPPDLLHTGVSHLFLDCYFSLLPVQHQTKQRLKKMNPCNDRDSHFRLVFSHSVSYIVPQNCRVEKKLWWLFHSFCYIIQQPRVASVATKLPTFCSGLFYCWTTLIDKMSFHKLVLVMPSWVTKNKSCIQAPC